MARSFACFATFFAPRTNVPLAPRAYSPIPAAGRIEPSRLDASLTIASSLRRVGHVRESLREVDQTIGKLVDVGHLQTPLSFLV